LFSENIVMTFVHLITTSSSAEGNETLNDLWSRKRLY